MPVVQVWARACIALTAAIVLSGCASPSQTTAATAATDGGTARAVKVAVVYSKTGPLSAYGAEYVAGFQAGLQYATHGTDKAGSHPIEVTYADDAGDPGKGVAAAKQYMGDGYRIIAGTADSGIAGQLAPLAAQNKVLYISGPAASDALTGINRYTFRSGRQTYQDVATAAAFLSSPQGKKVLVLAQDSTFGQGNATAVQKVLGSAGATVSKLLIPTGTTDFTPFAQQAKQVRADLVFVAWAGATTAAMWQSLDQQGLLSSTRVVTGLANTASFSAYGSATTKINFLSHYFAAAPDNAVNKAMTKAISATGAAPDLFSPDGFIAAQMIVHAVEKANGDDVDPMIAALEGWTFDGPKGSTTVRAQDHAMLQPMFEARLVKAKTGSGFEAQLVATVPAAKTAPPLKAAG